MSIFYRGDGQPSYIEGLFAGQTAVLVCNGPSAGSIDPSLLSRPGFVTMGVNNGAHQIRPTLWAGQDEPSKFMASIWEDPRIMKFTRKSHGPKKYWTGSDFSPRTIAQMPNMFFHAIHSDPAIDTWLDRDAIGWAAKDGPGHIVSIFLCALSILYKLGFVRVLLVGADFKMQKEKPYFFSEAKTDGEVDYNNRLFRRLDEQCRRLRPTFTTRGFEVINCTPDSGLTAFDAMDLRAALDGLALDTGLDTYGMYTSRQAKEAIVSQKYQAATKAIIYYSDNRIDGTEVNNASRKSLVESGLPIVSVTQKRIDFGNNIVVDKQPSGRSLIEQVIIGLEQAEADYVYLCEHDCIYHASHFDIVSGVIAYNENMWRLTPNGYHIHPHTKPVLSACTGPREKVLAAMRQKLEHYKQLEAQHAINGVTSRFGFLYEPGRGTGPAGGKTKCWLTKSKMPCLDVRHSQNFTGRGFLASWHYEPSIPHWGHYQELRRQLQLI